MLRGPRNDSESRRLARSRKRRRRVRDVEYKRVEKSTVFAVIEDEGVARR